MSATVIFRHPTGQTMTAEVGTLRQLVGRRGGGADIQLMDGKVSGRHGMLWCDEEGCWYEDVGSRHGSWFRGQRLRHPILLRGEIELILGETRLKLEATSTPCPPEGLAVRSTGQLGGQGLTEALAKRADSAGTYLTALYALTEGLLRHSSLEDFFPEALQRIREAVPVAQRIALVGWPPRQDGSLVHLAGETDSVSSSLAQYAVQEAQPLLLSTSNLPEGVANSDSVRLRGIRSAVYLPLQGKDDPQPTGVLCVDSPNCAIPFRELDFQFFCAVAGLLASRLSADRLRQEARLQAEENQHVEARREALVSFLQIASHDLKNPLMAIENCARILPRLPPERQAGVLDIILGASGKATDLIRTYLDAAAVESGKALEVEWQEVDLRKLVEDEIQFVQAALRDRIENTQFFNEIQCGPIQGDPRKLRQVVSNLISNAIKYSPQGGAIRVQGARNREKVQVRVSDEGVGISQENQARLFQPYERVGDRSLASGSGLGLWLTAAMIQAHGGRIGVESIPGQGSTFWFELPQPE